MSKKILNNFYITDYSIANETTLEYLGIPSVNPLVQTPDETHKLQLFIAVMGKTRYHLVIDTPSLISLEKQFKLLFNKEFEYKTIDNLRKILCQK